MIDHILLQRSVRRPHSDVPCLGSEVEYRAEEGLWYASSEVSKYFRPPMTKKFDIESGEDMKGE
ncbi:hypothetical protein [Rhodopseudomonas sp. WA056]|uniref:hypothetical protein n=1 Tax=Rhodopseudomonas sp. WA056 TaxID=2269367 RepID=UPI0013E0B87D|nr:hypothetical protein [Rhodopseudomonas sp. WA056]